MTPEEITVRYRWTFEALAEATRWRVRESGQERGIKCVRTPAGPMLCTHPGIFHWLPRDAFVTGSEFEALAETARRHVAVYRDLLQEVEAGPMARPTPIFCG